MSATEIEIYVLADVNNALSPGIFQGSVDGIMAWEKYINENGGLACRKVKITHHDTKINPLETTNGYLAACEKAFAIVGSTTLFSIDLEAASTCKDKAGQATGVLDLAERAIESVHQCNPTTFIVTGKQGACPLTGGEREYTSNVGGFSWFRENEVPKNGSGIFIIPADIPSAIAASLPVVRALQEVGQRVSDGASMDEERAGSVRAIQAQHGEFLSVIRDKNLDFVFSTSNQIIAKTRSEAMVQGGFENIKWFCVVSCYSAGFSEDESQEGTFVAIDFLPFHEREYNVELDLFLTYFNKGKSGEKIPPSWAAGAWLAGRVFEQLIDTVVEKHGVNGLTRKHILNATQALGKYDGREFFDGVDLSTGITSNCFVLLQVKNEKFARVFPDKPGTLDCSSDNLYTHFLDTSNLKIN